jgi:hypothetical protein
MIWGFLFMAIKHDISKEARSAFVQVLAAILMKFYCLWIYGSFHLKNCNCLFTRGSYFVVRCLHTFLALELFFAITSPHKHTGDALPCLWMSGSLLIYSYPSFFCSRTIYCRTVAPNISKSLSTPLYCFIGHKIIFTQMHNVRFTLSGFTNELWQP